MIDGHLQREGEVIHVVGKKLLQSFRFLKITMRLGVYIK